MTGLLSREQYILLIIIIMIALGAVKNTACFLFTVGKAKKIVNFVNYAM